MPLVSGDGGGGLPSQWTVDDTGALLITLTGASGDHDSAHGLRVFNSDGSSVLTLDSSGGFEVSAKDANAIPGTFQVPTKTAFSIDSALAVLTDYLVLKGADVHVAPADSALNAGECAFWYDQTNGAAKLMLKAKTANSSVVTAAIALA